MTSQERFSNVHAQLEHLQAKYVGTGHSDTTKLCVAMNAATPTRLAHMRLHTHLLAVNGR